LPLADETMPCCILAAGCAPARGRQWPGSLWGFLMSLHRVIAIVVVAVLLVFSSSPGEDVPESPPRKPGTPMTAPELLARFFAAIEAGDVDAVLALTDAVEGVPEEALRDSCQWVLESPGRPVRREIVAHLQLEDVAIVIFEEVKKESPVIDLDPAYLIRRDGAWRVLFGLTKYEGRHFRFSEQTTQRFRQLEEWYGQQKSALRKMLRDARR
jgi:hypothetical protein